MKIFFTNEVWSNLYASHQKFLEAAKKVGAKVDMVKGSPTISEGDYEPANCRIYNPNKPEKPISKTELLASLYKKEYALFHKILKEHDFAKKSEMEKEQRILLEKIAGLTGIDVNPDWDNFQLTMRVYATD